MAGIWVYADNPSLTLELLTAASSIAEGLKTGVAVILSHDRDRAQDYIDCGADEVFLLPPLSGDRSAGDYAPVIADAAREKKPDAILVAGTSGGKEIAARVAARLDTGLCGNCISMSVEGDSLVMDRFLYGGAAVQKVAFMAKPALATIPPRAYEPSRPTPGRQGEVEELPAPPISGIKVAGRRGREKRTEDISEAQVVVCAGRGFEKKEDLAMAREIADLLGGSVGCTRPVSEELHWLPEELCIGLSGIEVKPALYLGIGVSGQIQHVTGIRDAKIVSAVNKDENAPIFAVADMGIVGDLYEVLPKLISALKKAKG
ncbi:MAG: electron transfer flavoprotein subunit alpha/FixB family protein [Syntrophales bacterium]